MRNDLPYRLVDFARFHIGITELGGNNRGPMVECFQKAVDGKASGEAWCMAFVQYLIKELIRVHGGRTYLFASEHCLTVWNKTPPAMRIPFGARPQVGDIVIWRRGKTDSGHTGVVAEVFDGGSMRTVEGNTSGGPGIVREGDGVYLRDRPWNAGVGDMNLVGFIRPFS